MHQEISDRLDNLIYDEFIDYYFHDLRDKRFKREVEKFHEFSAAEVIEEMVYFMKSELSSLELPIWDIIKEEAHNEISKTN
ncbi:hypothetical protein SLH46_20335 [Draconibacterium sp. IB214405]|uniref:hypothetical protein n=1 Tax=Draconibacterium sp. IB214405 TaxID=3097352 RepID=UPI002A107F7A|nr:hypothetical protein [Draconibacterium sp. IB214405]MDX8341558.1 hypothetical protein [Draconibacterium sp. IB214405]